MNELSELRIEYEKRIDSLLAENEEMKEFFDKLSVPIIKRSVKNIERQLRQFPQEARQFGDDSNLNFFEEVCVMLQEGSMDDYRFVRTTILQCCTDAYDLLTNADRFIINHQSYVDEMGSVEIIETAFYEYASNYENNRINKAYYVRN